MSPKAATWVARGVNPGAVDTVEVLVVVTVVETVVASVEVLVDVVVDVTVVEGVTVVVKL